MRAKWLWMLIFCLALLLVAKVYSPFAQKPGKTVTLLYSNNINGEVDPCPT